MKCKYLEHQICIRPDGSYRLCCVSLEPDNVENIKTHTPQQWFESETRRKASEQLARGEWPDACIKCKLQEERGLESQRSKPRMYGPGLSHLDLRLGNSCNLKCVSCWGGSSSSIAEEDIELHNAGLFLNDNRLEVSNLNWANEETFKKLEDLPIQEIYFTGGEPMMVKHLDSFLERLDRSTYLRFNTNCTIWNPKLEKILRKFHVISMSLSLDAVDRKIEYIRYGSKWNNVSENAKRYADFCFVNIAPTISILNAWFYDDIKEYAEKNKWPLYENLLYQPSWLHCKNAPDSLKAKYQGISKDWTNEPADPKEIEFFKHRIGVLDKWRNISIRDYLPEVADAYGID